MVENNPDDFQAYNAKQKIKERDFARKEKERKSLRTKEEKEQEDDYWKCSGWGKQPDAHVISENEAVKWDSCKKLHNGIITCTTLVNSFIFLLQNNSQNHQLTRWFEIKDGDSRMVTQG